MQRKAVENALRVLELSESEVATVRERADALHPRNILAAGYAILRDGTGAPLTGVSAVRCAENITAEMRDGEASLVSTKTE